MDRWMDGKDKGVWQMSKSLKTIQNTIKSNLEKAESKVHHLQQIKQELIKNFPKGSPAVRYHDLTPEI